MASIHSAAENEWVLRLCEADCWLGYTDGAAEGSWAWSDGSEPHWFGFVSGGAPWYPGEPNGRPDEATDGAYMYANVAGSRGPGLWDDTDVADEKAFVCREPPPSPPPPHQPPQSPAVSLSLSTEVPTSHSTVLLIVGGVVLVAVGAGCIWALGKRRSAPLIATGVKASAAAVEMVFPLPSVCPAGRSTNMHAQPGDLVLEDSELPSAPRQPASDEGRSALKTRFV